MWEWDDGRVSAVYADRVFLSDYAVERHLPQKSINRKSADRDNYARRDERQLSVEPPAAHLLLVG